MACSLDDNTALVAAGEQRDYYNVKSTTLCRILCEVRSYPKLNERDRELGNRCLGSEFRCESYAYSFKSQICALYNGITYNSVILYVSSAPRICRSTKTIRQLDEALTCFRSSENWTENDEPDSLDIIGVYSKDLDDRSLVTEMPPLPRLPELPPLNSTYTTNTEAYQIAELDSIAEEFGLMRNYAFQTGNPTQGFPEDMFWGGMHGVEDWRYCAILCYINPLCNGWTFRSVAQILPPVIGPRTESSSKAGCFLKTAMGSLRRFEDSEMVLLSGSKDLVSFGSVSRDAKLRSWFGPDISIEFLKPYILPFPTSSFTVAKHSGGGKCAVFGQSLYSSSLPGVSTPGIMEASKDSFEDCFMRCKSLPGSCYYFQWVVPEFAHLVEAMAPLGNNCLLFDKMAKMFESDSSWPFVLIYTMKPTCQELDKTTQLGFVPILEGHPSIKEGDQASGISLKGPLVTDGTNWFVGVQSYQECKTLCDASPTCDFWTWTTTENCLLLKEAIEARQDISDHLWSGAGNRKLTEADNAFTSLPIGYKGLTLSFFGNEGGINPAAANPADGSSDLISEQRVFESCSSIFNGVRFKTSDESKFMSPNAQHCFTQCRQTTKCISFTYIGNEQVCYLHRGLNQENYKDKLNDVVSGYVVCDALGDPAVDYAHPTREFLPLILSAVIGSILLCSFVIWLIFYFVQRRRLRSDLNSSSSSNHTRVGTTATVITTSTTGHHHHHRNHYYGSAPMAQLPSNYASATHLAVTMTGRPPGRQV